jgi:CheY-like chemotaxis protein
MSATLDEIPETIVRPEPVKRAKYKILLVDDDPSIRQILSKLLAQEDYSVLATASGIEAIELVTIARVDLVVLDLQLPVKDGWEIFTQLSTQHPLLPVILITAYPSQLFSALAAGAGALLEKPLDFTKLADSIRNVLSEPREARRARMRGQSAQFHFIPSNEVVSRKAWRVN